MDEPSLKRGGESTELLQSRKSRCAKAEAECDEACRSGGSTNVAQVLGAEGDDDKDGDDGGDDESQSDPELSQCYNHCTNERKRCEGGK
jgi:hypothetical protein